MGGRRSNMLNTRDSVSSGYPNTEKRVENMMRSGVFDDFRDVGNTVWSV